MPISQEQRQRCFNFYGRKCYYCEEVLNGLNTTVDHIIPEAEGGTHDLDNLIPCCLKCNVDKKNMYLDEWLAIIRIRRNKFFAKAKAMNKVMKNIEKRLLYRKILTN